MTLRPGTFGAVSPSFETAFQGNRTVTTNLLSVVPAALVGVITGVMAAGFTAGPQHSSTFRLHVSTFCRV
jgi:hypothetical protein